MQHPIKSLLILVFVVAASYSSISYSQSKSRSSNLTSDKFDGDQLLGDIIKRVKKDYVEEKTYKELSEAAAEGVLSSLDPHSSYLNADDLKEMKVQTKGEFGGLGIEITMHNSLVKIISPIEGTPADKAGIESGDYISRIEGNSVVGLKIGEVVKKLRGKPNTKVSITVLRAGEKSPLEIVITRKIIKIKAVRSDVIKNIAYVKINTFSGQASSGMISALNKMIKQIGADKIQGIVLDLRGNPGGLLNESIKVSGLFLDKGKTIVSIAGRGKTNEKIYKDDSNQTLTKNIALVVLIDEGSASASEIVAGALQDNKRAIILGAKSFGKGSVQSIVPLDKNRGAVKMTTALYYTPLGKSIQAHGIEPDILVGDAKIEKSTKENKSSESSLNGHLKNQIDNEIKSAKKVQIDDTNIDLYNEDYRLARAIDLLRGISVYKEIKK
ncbi:MAG: carboxyl-terminal processing protease [Lentimonas sp.]|jgi:carboxyl-terminal processing protease